MKCKNCGAELNGNSKFCLNCGAEVSTRGNTCPNCGHENPIDQDYCGKCGWSLNKTSDFIPDSFTPSAPEKTLSTGAIIAIILGIIVVALILIMTVFFTTQNNNSKKTVPVSNNEKTENTASNDNQKPKTNTNDTNTGESNNYGGGQTIDPDYSPSGYPRSTNSSGSSSNTSSSGSNASANSSSGDYIIPDSSSRYLSESDLVNLSERDLTIARNEIAARHGRKFKIDWIASYFESMPWYSGTVDADTFDANSGSYLSSVESTNMQTILNYEKKMGYE